MAKLVTKFKFIKPGKKARGYLKYIATREGVDKIDDSKKYLPASKEQKDLIEKILRDFPDTKDMHEYDDYRCTMTVGDASEFINRALEDNAQEMMTGKTYADYIATRPRAQRFGSHGLFTNDGVSVNLSEVSEELNQHQGNVWTAILSLRREDAARLGFDDGYRWRDMLRTQTAALSKNLKIPMKNLRWFAAFHDESHHPHVHLIAYSTNPNEGYLTKQGVNNLRSSFAKDIFAQDLLCVYEQQTEHRNMLRANSREVISEIVSKINSDSYDNPKLKEMLRNLADRLSKTSGKKVYGYLKSDVKAIINSIVDEMQKDERIQKLYDLWYEQRFAILRTYTDAMPEKVPLSENKEFRSIKNAVIREAVRLSDGDLFLVDEEAAEELPLPEVPGGEEEEPEEVRQDGEYEELLRRRNKNRWEHYRLAKLCLDKQSGCYDPQEAVRWLIKAAEQDFDLAQYRLGKMLLRGDLVEQDIPYALEWLGKAAAHGNSYAEYLLGKELVKGENFPKDTERGLELLERSAAQKNRYAQYMLGTIYLKGKVVQKWTEKAIRLLTASADQGLDAAEYTVGRLLLLGDEELPKQPQKAVLYLERAADKGNASAQYLLGKTYLQGEEIPKDVPRALRYLERASEQNHQWARLLLGRLYLYGQEVEQDTEKALTLLNASANQGNPYAAAVMKHHQDVQTAATRIGVLRLWESVFRIFQNHLSEQEHRCNPIDRKLRRRINEKKAAQGLKWE